MQLRTCIHPSGRFVYGLHKPAFTVRNLREHDFIGALGKFTDGSSHENRRNFPPADIEVEQADWIYEIANPFPFRGTTFISQSWAQAKAENPAAIRLPQPAATSLHESIAPLLADNTETGLREALKKLPEPFLLTLAATSTDPQDLLLLARLCCKFIFNEKGDPVGLAYQREANGRIRAVISRHDLFETVANNIHLPDSYKAAMVLRPGVQGDSEIVGEYSGKDCHIFEYLRRNSYIPWGHYASNMADDTVRYRTGDLSATDMHGLRHLYYQRTFVRLAGLLGIEMPPMRRTMQVEDLEKMRRTIQTRLAEDPHQDLAFNSTLWGWNFGYDFAASGYRLHASHQQIHQQFALLPPTVSAWHSGNEEAKEAVPSYGCGDLIAEFCRDYKAETGRDFFAAYLAAIRTNQRMDQRTDRPAGLIVYEDDNVILFVPKAQTSQWELQIMPTAEVGNILEADTACRDSLDRALLIGQQVLAALGARMVTSIEFTKRLDNPDPDQRLIYALLPKLPYSMGAFSEAQLRWINGHFPEDFAAACREHLPPILTKIESNR